MGGTSEKLFDFDTNETKRKKIRLQQKTPMLDDIIAKRSSN